MRRSILHIIVSSLVAATAAGCANDVVPTGPMPGASHDHFPVEKLDPIGIDPNAYATITAGMDFTCARRNDNTVYCWGKNDYNQIGFISSSRSTKCVSNAMCVATPTLIRALSGPLKALELDAGARHACILDEQAAAWCWGDGDDGQLGYAAGGGGSPGEPLPVVGGLTFTQLGAGGNSTCGTTEKQGMFCWGFLSGRHTVPTQISPDSRYISVAVGEGHACALRFFKADRLVDCWGNNSYGQLGIDPQFSPAAFSAASGFGPAVNDVTTQDDFTCVDQLSGVVQCAGVNDFGQLGNGQFTPARDPQTVGGGQLLHSVTTGYYHACALDVNNAAWCWGDGNNGQLGNGMSGAGVKFNTPQLVLGGGTYRSIAVGELHTCAIGMDNNIYCWGNNGSGELGIGLSGGEVHTTPVQVVRPRS